MTGFNAGVVTAWGQGIKHRSSSWIGNFKEAPLEDSPVIAVSLSSDAEALAGFVRKEPFSKEMSCC